MKAASTTDTVRGRLAYTKRPFSLRVQDHSSSAGSVLEHLAYCDALNHSRAIAETRSPTLNARALELVTDLLEHLRSGKEAATAA